MSDETAFDFFEIMLYKCFAVYNYLTVFWVISLTNLFSQDTENG